MNTQQVMDSNFAQTISAMEKEYRLGYFMEYSCRLSDSIYWQVLAAIWMDTDVCSPNLELWNDLFTSKRRNRQKIMKKADRKFWRKLPKVVTAYRAANNSEEVETAMSWTLDISVARKLSKGRIIYTRLISKSLIIAFFNRRGEQEIIVQF